MLTSPHTRAGVVYAVLAGASAGLLLFLPSFQSCCWPTASAWLTLREGNYVFLIAGPGGELPGVPPLSMAVLEVVP